MDALVAVRGRIARAILGADVTDDRRLGDITLLPHQAEAVRRLRSALDAHGGALLADAPGLGKTYVALAVARACGGRAVVVAPATLRGQWQRSAAHAAQPIEWCSLETLSRRPFPSGASLLIVDEAHHLRTARTRRYAHAAALAVGKRVLLLTATPVHNRPADRDALLALFLGRSASTPDPWMLSQLVVRREADPALLPSCRPRQWLAPPRTAGVAALLRALPPPLPAADGREAAALVELTLAHAWSSSLGALDDTLRRAMQHARALDDALAAGRWPTRRELRAWTAGDDGTQLAFPEFVASPAGSDPGEARAMLARHVRALDALRAITRAARTGDADARAALLRRVVRRHRGATVVAFSRYAGTIDALWRALRFDPGVAAITSRGVRSAGGGLSRPDVLRALADAGAATDARAPLRLVLSTDLLGEGLDLRAASVIVHLDQPWTPARLDQREGRARRLGSPHRAVSVYAVRPPREAAQRLALASRVAAKRSAMTAGVAPGSAREALLTLVRPWLVRGASRSRLAAIHAPDEGWVAVVRDTQGRERVLTMLRGKIAEDDARLLDALQRADHGRPVAPCVHAANAARRAIRFWLRSDASAQLARVSHADDAPRAAAARRLDTLLRAAPLLRRAALQPRIDATRATMATLRGAGVERALASATRCTSIEELLDALDTLGSAAPHALSPRRATRLLALLLFVPRW